MSWSSVGYFVGMALTALAAGLALGLLWKLGGWLFRFFTAGWGYGENEVEPRPPRQDREPIITPPPPPPERLPGPKD